MLRNYICKTIPKYSSEDLENALKAIKEGNESIRKVAEIFKIPRTTLQDRLSNVWKSRIQVIGRETYLGAGRPKEISDVVELHLMHGIQYLGSMGWFLEIEDIPKVIKIFLDNAGMSKRFKNNFPGKDWVCGFFKRHNMTFQKENQNFSLLLV